MNSLLPIYLTNKKDFQRFGNSNNFEDGIYIELSGTMLRFVSPYVASLSAISTMEFRKVNKSKGVIQIDSNGDIEIEQTFTVSSPGNFITKATKGGKDCFYADGSVGLPSEIVPGIYYIYLTDGTTEFESDIFYIKDEILQSFAENRPTTNLTNIGSIGGAFYGQNFLSTRTGYAKQVVLRKNGNAGSYNDLSFRFVEGRDSVSGSILYETTNVFAPAFGEFAINMPPQSLISGNQYAIEVTRASGVVDVTQVISGSTYPDGVAYNVNPSYNPFGSTDWWFRVLG